MTYDDTETDELTNEMLVEYYERVAPLAAFKAAYFAPHKVDY